ncbi:MAG: AAA family ATPase, partial [Gammaproteobacteria bacterium]|nr:AAA family ATPase [Gammaproteobacteria bacterium]
MIRQLYVKNFKSLKETDLEIKNLNLLTGLNGSGKSSLIQT